MGTERYFVHPACRKNRRYLRSACAINHRPSKGGEAMFISRSFRRFTTLLFLVLALAALLSGANLTPAAGAQVSTVPDVGDAPDSTNAFGAAIHASPDVLARFPTALLPNGQPPGPRHINPELFYYLGNSISGEAQA